MCQNTGRKTSWYGTVLRQLQSHSISRNSTGKRVGSCVPNHRDKRKTASCINVYLSIRIFRSQYYISLYLISCSGIHSLRRDNPTEHTRFSAFFRADSLVGVDARPAAPIMFKSSLIFTTLFCVFVTFVSTQELQKQCE
jgi:hypothetical protein